MTPSPNAVSPETVTFPHPTVIVIAAPHVQLNLEVEVRPHNQHVKVHVDLLKHDTLILEPIGSGNNSSSPIVHFEGFDVEAGDQLIVTTRVTVFAAEPTAVEVKHRFTPPNQIHEIHGSTSLPYPAEPKVIVSPPEGYVKFNAKFNIQI